MKEDNYSVLVIVRDRAMEAIKRCVLLLLCSPTTKIPLFLIFDTNCHFSTVPDARCTWFG